MQVIGIDVAPGKGGHVFDGESLECMSPERLSKYLKEEVGDDVLLAWDAPLTGPPDPCELTGDKHDLTIRQIERFFRVKDGEQAPKGISVLEYGRCPHWTISQHMLGLPRVSQWASDKLPFKLVTSDKRPSKGHYIVEVHPAVGLWLWFEEERKNQPWTYKNKKQPTEDKNQPTNNKKPYEILRDLADLLSQRMEKTHGIRVKGPDEKPDQLDDDVLDAYAAWYLADRWMNDENHSVRLLGNAASGCFLVPDPDETLKDKFEYWLEKQGLSWMRRGALR